MCYLKYKIKTGVDLKTTLLVDNFNYYNLILWNSNTKLIAFTKSTQQISLFQKLSRPTILNKNCYIIILNLFNKNTLIVAVWKN